PQTLVMIETLKKPPIPKPVVKEPPPKPKEEPKKTVAKPVKQQSAPPKATASRTLLSSKAPTPTDAGTVSDVQMAGSRGLTGTEIGGEEQAGATREGVVGGTGGTDTVEVPLPPPPPLIEAKAKLGSKQQPDYPEIAQQNNWEGRVLLSAYIKEDGSIGEVKVVKSSGHGELDEAAIAALRGWRFEPARRGEVAQGSWVRVPFTFTLQ
ncbi:MAG: energy transducer TonB, partial [Gemmatimonadaceae bacterium]|nr:energy transducer TonB [Gloeobacterales cyanobacterium ES-bin-141]